MNLLTTGNIKFPRETVQMEERENLYDVTMREQRSLLLLLFALDDFRLRTLICTYT